MAIAKTDAFAALMDNKDFVVKMLSQETPEAVQELFRENGVDLTMDEVLEFGRELEKAASSGDELDEEMLANVSGGIVIESATAWAIAKCVIAVGSAGLAIYKWYKSR